jgi:hypothetical protein
MTKYNLGLGAFIAVIASTAYLLGYFSAAYVGKVDSTEINATLNNLSGQFGQIVELAKDHEMSETYQNFYVNKIFLNSLHSFEEPPVELIERTERELSDVIPSLECMLGQFSDPKMRERAVEQINEVKALIKYTHNQQLQRTP